MNATQRLAPGLYLIQGSADGDGQEYHLYRNCDHPDMNWVVADSRGRFVSRHFTKGDAVQSVEVMG